MDTPVTVDSHTRLPTQNNLHNSPSWLSSLNSRRLLHKLVTYDINNTRHTWLTHVLTARTTQVGENTKNNDRKWLKERSSVLYYFFATRMISLIVWTHRRAAYLPSIVYVMHREIKNQNDQTTSATLVKHSNSSTTWITPSSSISNPYQKASNHFKNMATSKSTLSTNGVNTSMSHW